MRTYSNSCKGGTSSFETGETQATTNTSFCETGAMGCSLLSLLCITPAQEPRPLIVETQVGKVHLLISEMPRPDRFGGCNWLARHSNALGNV